MVVVCIIPIRRMVMSSLRIRATASATRIASVAHSVSDVYGVVVGGRGVAHGVIAASANVCWYCWHR